MTDNIWAGVDNPRPTLRCRIGLHRWATLKPAGKYLFTDRRICRDCGKGQIRYLEGAPF